MKFDELLKDSRSKSSELRELLHTGRLSPHDVSPDAKIPFKARVLRECLLWRVVELTDQALDAISAGRSVAGCVLARAAIEPAALLCALHRKVDQSISANAVDEIDEFLMKGLFGRRLDETDLTAHNVLSSLDKLDKVFEPVSGQKDTARRFYEVLSEVAHPNYEGVVACYCSDGPISETEIGPKTHPETNVLSLGLRAVRFSMGVAAKFHGEIVQLDDSFRSTCERNLPMSS